MLQLSRISTRLSSPVHAGSLATFRVLFGICMLLDALHERGLINAANKFSDPYACMFPLFDFVTPLSVTGFHLLLGTLIISSIGITIGFMYRLCTIAVAAIHWYLFFLDKRKWNNHSYLFATISTLLCFLDAHVTMSVDSLLYSGCRKCCCRAEQPMHPQPPHVPAWQVWIVRVLHSMVYSIAGLKKLMDFDWTGGYAMTDMSSKPLFQVIVKPYVFLPVLAVYRYSLGGASPYAHAQSTNNSLHAYIHEHDGDVVPWWFIELTEEDESLFDNSIGHFIHTSGLFFDLFVGWMLCSPRLRKVALLSCVGFHVMTTQMFSIGLFPWVSLCLLTIWLKPNWTDCRWCRWCRSSVGTSSSDATTANKTGTLLNVVWLHASCVANADTISEQFPALPETIQVDIAPATIEKETADNKGDGQSTEQKKKNNNKNNKKKWATEDKEETTQHASSVSTVSLSARFQPTFRHHMVTFLLALLIAFEIFLPYSHFITKGYNSWTQGLYGYSWDMMIHTWRTQHVRIAIKSPGREEFFIRPTAFINNGNMRNFKHPDMLKQYAQCVRHGLENMGIPNASVYVDVWRSMNKRYQQRFVNPNVDLVTAPWSPYTSTPWIFPCLFDYDHQREELDEIAERYAKDNREVVFVADFPNMSLEHYVNGTETKSTTLLLMHGDVEVQFENGEVYRVPKNQNVSLPLNATHMVKTLGDTPSRYMYSYEGRSLQQEEEDRLSENATEWEKVLTGWEKEASSKMNAQQYLKMKSKDLSDRTSPYAQMVNYADATQFAWRQALWLFNNSVHEFFVEGTSGVWPDESSDDEL